MKDQLEFDVSPNEIQMHVHLILPSLILGILRELARQGQYDFQDILLQFGRIHSERWSFQFKQIHLQSWIIKELGRLVTYYCNLNEYIWKDVVSNLNKYICKRASSENLLGQFLNQSSIWASFTVFSFYTLLNLAWFLDHLDWFVNRLH